MNRISFEAHAWRTNRAKPWVCSNAAHGDDVIVLNLLLQVLSNRGASSVGSSGSGSSGSSVSSQRSASGSGVRSASRTAGTTPSRSSTASQSRSRPGSARVTGLGAGGGSGQSRQGHVHSLSLSHGGVGFARQHAHARSMSVSSAAASFSSAAASTVLEDLAVQRISDASAAVPAQLVKQAPPQTLQLPQAAAAAASAPAAVGPVSYGQPSEPVGAASKLSADEFRALCKMTGGQPRSKMLSFQEFTPLETGCDRARAALH